MLATPLRPPFLDTYSRSISSLRCKALCLAINFRVLCSLCQRFSIFHFKNSPEYLTRETAKLFIPLIRFLLQSLVSRFLVLLRYSFLIVSFISASLMVSASNIPKSLKFNPSSNVLMFS